MGLSMRKEESVSKRKRVDIEYNEWRMEVFQRDGFTCVRCGASPSGELRAHHILSYTRYPNARYKVSNGVTLCKDCHIEFHGIYTYTNFTELDFMEFMES
jgi:5-methylcytosine-specific restriction endonuclease McrA